MMTSIPFLGRLFDQPYTVSQIPNPNRDSRKIIINESSHTSTMEAPTSFVCHDHTLTFASGFAFRCYWCRSGGYISNGYHCITCDRWFHKSCVICKFSKEIRHTSHPEHTFRLFSFKQLEIQSRSHRCEVCTRFIVDNDWTYVCWDCREFIIHASCAIEPPLHTIKDLMVDEHPLVLYPISKLLKHHCKTCKNIVSGKLAYTCFQCNVFLHVECLNSPEVNHPYHSKHSLKLLISGAPDYTDNTCLLCESKFEDVLYHCSKCDFSVCLVCVSNPPPIYVENLKTHEHKLTLIARQILFTCNACGMQGSRSPYFCLQCDFMVHQSCIGLPRFININGHTHCISHSQQLINFGFDPKCSVCFQSVNRFYGAYTCSMCINYIVHSQCATTNDVWDGIELEGTPKEIEDTTPFRKVGNELINHFSHEIHNLELKRDYTMDGGSIRCEACMLYVYSDSVYSCEKCDFILHEICANLPRKKHHMFHNKPFTLRVEGKDSSKIFSCNACEEFFNGFRYESDHVVLDVQCILKTDNIFFTEKHEHPLYYKKTYMGKCDACHREVKSGGFSCGLCDFILDFRCATLLETVNHICDQHPLSLSSKENACGKYWCDICEEEIEPNIWFYMCSVCVVALHVNCVFGGLSRLKPRQTFIFQENRWAVIPNNYSSRPKCSDCGVRCKALFIIKGCTSLNTDRFLCSDSCLIRYHQKYIWVRKSLHNLHDFMQGKVRIRRQL